MKQRKVPLTRVKPQSAKQRVHSTAKSVAIGNTSDSMPAKSSIDHYRASNLQKSRHGANLLGAAESKNSSTKSKTSTIRTTGSTAAIT